MQTIKNNVNNEIIIKNSKFICYLYKIKSIEDINKILSNLKEEYKDATHHCYAYILDNLKKSSDDGEPGGTAGIPILKVLENNNLTNILAVVIRYFGGIKLGAGGLVRAYSNTVSETIRGLEIIENIEYKTLNIEFSYKKVGIIFINNGLSINFIFLLIFSPIILYIYVKQTKNLRYNYSNYYNIEIINKNKRYKYTGYMDSGNVLVDTLTKKSVILIDKRKL